MGRTHVGLMPLPSAFALAFCGMLLCAPIVRAEEVPVGTSCVAASGTESTGEELLTSGETPGRSATETRDASATSASEPPLLFAEDFEAFGTFHDWSGSEDTMTVQDKETFRSRYGVRATSTGLPAFAQKDLQGSYNEIYYRLRFRVVSQGDNPVVLQRLRTDRNEMVLSVYVNKDGTIGYYNHIANRNTESSVKVSDGQWHEVQVRLKIDGRESEIDIWLDQLAVDISVTKTWLGNYGIGRIDLGDNSGARRYDIAYDDIVVATSMIPPERLPDPVRGTLTVRAFPPRAGVRFELDGRSFTTKSDGVARIDVVRWSTDLSERIRVPDSELADERLSFAGWQEWNGPLDNDVDALFDVVRPVSWNFVDQEGRSVDAALIGSITFQNSIGGVVTYTRPSPRQLQHVRVTRPVRHQGGYVSKPVIYVVQNVCVSGTNVVNQGQARFDPTETSEWKITLLFYSANFRVRDALFGTPLGKAIRLQYPDGTTRDAPLGSTGEAVLPALPRGEYQVSVLGGGYAPPRPIALTRDQQVDLTVISQLDIALAGGMLSLVGLGLLIIGRPRLVLAPIFLVHRRGRKRAGPSPALFASVPLPHADVGRAAAPRPAGPFRRHWVIVLTAVLVALALLVGVRVTGFAASEASPVASLEADRSSDRFVPVLAYYYIWFDETSWRRAKTDLPLLGRYSSDDPAVTRQHVRWAKAAGIDGFIVSWKDTQVLTRRLDQLVEIANQEDFKLAIIYQGLDFSRSPIPIERIEADLDFFYEKYADNRAFDMFDRPVVIWSGTWEFTPQEIATVTKSRQQRLMILASERNPDSYEAIADFVAGNAYYWSSVDPSTYPGYREKLVTMARAVHADGGLWIAPAAPGFDARHMGGERSVDRQDGTTLRKEVSAALASSPDAIGLISWNEFSENSHVEPSCAYGVRYLEALAELTGGNAPAGAPTCDRSALVEATVGAVTGAAASPTPGSGGESTPGAADSGSDFDSSSPGDTQVRARSLAVLLGLGALMVASVATVIQRSRREAVGGQPGKLGHNRKGVT
ncbi:MAG: hypothetical protein QOF73_5012 [Thermomicrobiales bacterium]|jgi:hypothetical protein|nr:hypothetical protein [Thermomicrobiales bacterium]